MLKIAPNEYALFVRVLLGGFAWVIRRTRTLVRPARVKRAKAGSRPIRHRRVDRSLRLPIMKTVDVSLLGVWARVLAPRPKHRAVD